MAYRITLFPTTMSDFQRRLLIACLFKCDFPYSCAVIDKISTDTVRRVVLV